MCDNYRYRIAISHGCRCRLRPVSVHARFYIRGRANSCHSPEQGVLQRYIPCRCSVFSLGTPFFATRAKGATAPCRCVHRPPLFSEDRIPITVASSLRTIRQIDPWTDTFSDTRPKACSSAPSSSLSFLRFFGNRSHLICDATNPLPADV